MPMKLYYGPGACSLAAHIVMEEVGVEYDTQRMNLAEGDQRKPDYLKLNPRGRVPTLVVDGQVLTENLGIVTYFAGGYPDAGLWPRATWDQARLVSTLAWFSNTVHPAYGHYMRTERYVDDDACRPAVKAKGAESFHGYLREIDALVAGRRWCVADQYTPAEPYMLVFYRWANRMKLPVRQLRHYTALIERVLDRPAVQRVMADEGITLD